MKIDLSPKQISTLLALLDLEISDIRNILYFDDISEDFKKFYSIELSDYIEISNILSNAMLSD